MAVGEDSSDDCSNESEIELDADELERMDQTEAVKMIKFLKNLRENINIKFDGEQVDDNDPSIKLMKKLKGKNDIRLQGEEQDDDKDSAMNVFGKKKGVDAQEDEKVVNQGCGISPVNTEKSSESDGKKEESKVKVKIPRMQKIPALTNQELLEIYRETNPEGAAEIERTIAAGGEFPKSQGLRKFREAKGEEGGMEDNQALKFAAQQSERQRGKETIEEWIRSMESKGDWSDENTAHDMKRLGQGTVVLHLDRELALAKMPSPLQPPLLICTHHLVSLWISKSNQMPRLSVNFRIW